MHKNKWKIFAFAPFPKNNISEKHYSMKMLTNLKRNNPTCSKILLQGKTSFNRNACDMMQKKKEIVLQK